jgi:hypothetical protein
MGSLSLKLALFTLIGFVGLLGSSWPANALNVICEEDCSQFEVPALGDGSAFDPLALGFETTQGDLTVKVSTKGNVYLVGPISAEKASNLKATNIIIDDPTMVPEQVRLKTRNLLTTYPSVASSSTSGTSSDDPSTRIRIRIREKKGNILVKSNGDLYIDVSATDLVKLKIKARGSIIVTDEALTAPVPEPTTAVLMALGLVGLSLKRARSGVH